MMKMKQKVLIALSLVCIFLLASCRAGVLVEESEQTPLPNISTEEKEGDPSTPTTSTSTRQTEAQHPLPSSSVKKQNVSVFVSWVHHQTLDELKEDADYIVYGRVVKQWTEWRVFKDGEDPENTKNPGVETTERSWRELVTISQVEILDSFGKMNPGKTIDVQLLGGETDDTIFEVSPTAKIVVGASYVFFLKHCREYENTARLMTPYQALYLAANETVINGYFPLTFEMLHQWKTK